MLEHHIQPIVNIPIDAIRPGRYQPRKSIQPWHIDELVESFRSQGQIEPIIVMPTQHEGLYELISGEYRWRAAQKIGWSTIKGIVEDGEPRSAAVRAIVANAGLPLNPMDEAEAFARLHDEFGMTHCEIAREVGKGRNRAYVSKALRLLQLPRPIRDMLSDESLSKTHGEILLQCPTDKVLALAERAVKGQWSSRQLTREVERLGEGEGSLIRGRDYRTQDWIELQESWSEKIGLPVNISPKKNKKSHSFQVTFDCSDEGQVAGLLKHMDGWLRA